jgi:hypothetical protein
MAIKAAAKMSVSTTNSSDVVMRWYNMFNEKQELTIQRITSSFYGLEA